MQKKIKTKNQKIKELHRYYKDKGILLNQLKQLVVISLRNRYFYQLGKAYNKKRFPLKDRIALMEAWKGLKKEELEALMQEVGIPVFSPGTNNQPDKPDTSSEEDNKVT